MEDTGDRMGSVKIPSEKRPMAQKEIFSGWKEIARYLGKGVRTVQRYERELGLPIHRPSGAVISTKGELDSWVGAGAMRAVPTIKRWPASRINRNGVNFLLIDSQIALTFSAIALGARDEEKRRRTTLTARRAYDTIQRLRKNVNLTDAEREKLDANVQRLEKELHKLSQSSEISSFFAPPQL
jgi:hypothetical protein